MGLEKKSGTILTALGRYVGKKGVAKTDPAKIEKMLEILTKSNGNLPSHVLLKTQYPTSMLKNILTLGGHGWAQKQRMHVLGDLTNTYTQSNTGLGRAMRMLTDSGGMLDAKTISKSLISKTPKGRGFIWRALRRKEFENRLNDAIELKGMLGLKDIKKLNIDNISRIKMV